MKFCLLFCSVIFILLYLLFIGMDLLLIVSAEFIFLRTITIVIFRYRIICICGFNIAIRTVIQIMDMFLVLEA